jgi:hypothetical protein
MSFALHDPEQPQQHSLQTLYDPYATHEQYLGPVSGPQAILPQHTLEQRLAQQRLYDPYATAERSLGHVSGAQSILTPQRQEQNALVPYSPDQYALVQYSPSTLLPPYHPSVLSPPVPHHYHQSQLDAFSGYRPPDRPFYRRFDGAVTMEHNFIVNPDSNAIFREHLHEINRELHGTPNGPRRAMDAGAQPR